VFRFGAETVPIHCPVDGQDSVEVIHLVLQQFGESARSTERVRHPAWIQVAERYGRGSFNLHQ
jgi:hypothetical protein